jgi:molecular chaperone DnaJ
MLGICFFIQGGEYTGEPVWEGEKGVDPECRGAGETISDPCKACKGEGRVQKESRIKLRIPAGVDTGTRLRSTSNGDAGVRGGPSGDLYVFLHIRDHDVFERDDSDLFCEVPLPFSTAALGGELKVPTLDGQSSIKIPAGTQGGTVFRLREKGMPSLSGGRRGDLNVRVSRKNCARFPNPSACTTRRCKKGFSKRRSAFLICE